MGINLLVQAVFVVLTSSTALDAPEVVRRVIDGDTIVMTSGERVRVANVDAPEMRCRCEAECYLAQRATQVTRMLTRDGVFLARQPNRDRYRRTLARVVLRDGRDLGEVLVARGLGRSYHGERRLSWCDGTAPRP